MKQGQKTASWLLAEKHYRGGNYWAQINPHIADQLPLLEQDQRFPPTKIERAKESELALVDRKSLCVKECFHVMYLVVAHRRYGESDQAGQKEDVDWRYDKDWQKNTCHCDLRH